MTKLIDLRSDTVSRPTDAMRRAMAAAEVGDDVFGDDPTIHALEERAAELLGKEAGLFVASGTMGNVVAQLAHLARGQETIAGREHHMTVDEAAGHAVIVGTSIRALDDRPDGTLALEDIEAAFRNPLDTHEPITGHDHPREHPRPLRGAAAPARATSRPSARSPGDAASPSTSTARGSGTRSSPSGRTASPPATWPVPADTVTFCLSKGLGCPVGSVVVGSQGRHLARPARPQAARWRACARPASSPPPGWSPSRTARPG